MRQPLDARAGIREEQSANRCPAPFGLDRAKLHDAADLPPDTVAINSEIDFVDERTGARRIVRLVYPADANAEAGRISIMTPIGAGLGMRAGDSILWPDCDGHDRMLRILNVVAPSQGPAS